MLFLLFCFKPIICNQDLQQENNVAVCYGKFYLINHGRMSVFAMSTQSKILTASFNYLRSSYIASPRECGRYTLIHCNVMPWILGRKSLRLSLECKFLYWWEKQILNKKIPPPFLLEYICIYLNICICYISLRQGKCYVSCLKSYVHSGFTCWHAVHCATWHNSWLLSQ